MSRLILDYDQSSHERNYARRRSGLTLNGTIHSLVPPLLTSSMSMLRGPGFAEDKARMY